MEPFPTQVYYTLYGVVLPEYRIPGVENAFADEAECTKLYFTARDAYERICERLGVIDEDNDLEDIFNSLLDIAKILSLKMYHYGAVFGEP